MAEYLAVADQNVALNQPIIFTASIPCNRGYVWHEDETGIFILRGIVNSNCGCFARDQVTYNGNASIPTGGEISPIGVSIAVNGETRPSSLAVYTPTAVDTFGNLTSTCIVTVPKGCCFTVSVRYVPADDDPATTPTPVITVANSNLVISRIA